MTKETFSHRNYVLKIVQNYKFPDVQGIDGKCGGVGPTFSEAQGALIEAKPRLLRPPCIRAIASF